MLFFTILSYRIIYQSYRIVHLYCSFMRYSYPIISYRALILSGFFLMKFRLYQVFREDRLTRLYVYHEHRLSFRIVYQSYRIVRVYYSIVRLSYHIVYLVKNNVTGIVHVVKYCL